ncbi:MAG: hypothetical protein ACTSVC_14625, partial [Promethearchaeota archaeon]
MLLNLINPNLNSDFMITYAIVVVLTINISENLYFLIEIFGLHMPIIIYGLYFGFLTRKYTKKSYFKRGTKLLSNFYFLMGIALFFNLSYFLLRHTYIVKILYIIS